MMGRRTTEGTKDCQSGTNVPSVFIDFYSSVDLPMISALLSTDSLIGSLSNWETVQIIIRYSN